MTLKNLEASQLRFNDLFWLFVIVLVLNEVVLVLVIDFRVILRRRFSDTINFHCHPSQHGNDPLELQLHFTTKTKVQSARCRQDVLDGSTLER